MAKVVCKSSNEIFYIRIGLKGDSVFSESKFDFRNALKSGGRYVDMRMLRLDYYDGYHFNEHHITTKSFYGVVLPFLSYIMQTFNFNRDDFEDVPFFTKDKKHDISYLKPKTDMKFTMEINGHKIGEHLSFDNITNMKTVHKDTKAYKGYKEVDATPTDYHHLYRGAHACSRVINETIDNDRKIFISGDSMMIPAIPILCCYYKEVVYMDNRDGVSHKDYFENDVFDEVLLCFYERSDINKVIGVNLK